MFMFSHIFSLLCEFTFLIFWELYVLMPHMKYVRNPQLWNVCVFPYISFTMRIQLFLMFLELYGFLFYVKQSSVEYITKTFGIIVFSHNFPVLGKLTIPMFQFQELYGFLLLPKYVRKTWPWDVLLSHTFPILSPNSPCFGDNTADVKNNENFLFLIPFSHKLFIKKLSLFCSQAQPNIRIFYPFVIEVWKCIQFRRAGSVFYSSVSIAIFP